MYTGDMNDKSIVSLCYGMEAHLVQKWWGLVRNLLTQKMPVRWSIPTVGDPKVTLYANLSSKWSEMKPSSRPPNAKNADQWRKFCHGHDVRIAELYVIVPRMEEDDSIRLQEVGQKFDWLCDLVYVSLYWTNLITEQDTKMAMEKWNVIELENMI